MNPNAQSKSTIKPFFKACRDGDSAKVEACLKAGAKANARTEDGYIREVTPLMLAADVASAACVKLLLEAGADVNAKTQSESGGAGNNTALHFALLSGKVEQKHLDVICLLLDAGANPDTPANDGDTPLSDAARIGSKQLVEMLIKANATSHLQAGLRFPPLHAAAVKGSAEIVELLLKQKVPIDLRNDKGETALMAAARCGQGKVAEQLLQAGADANAASADGKTVFMWASLFARDAEHEAAETAMKLLDRFAKLGVDLNRKDSEGKSAFDLASSAYDADVSKFMKKLGANPPNNPKRK